MLDLKDIRERLESLATPGPWQVEKARYVPSCHAVYRPHGALVVDEIICHRDAHFIANAPTDIEALIAEVERLRALVAEMAPHAVEGAAEYGEHDLVDKFRPYAGPPYSG